MKEQVFEVEGIMCPKCVNKITEVLLNPNYSQTRTVREKASY